jgi:ABC-2 type transport system permease protein
MPAVVLPQVLLCGLLVPREQMPDILRWISDVLPLSYAVDAMRRVTVSTAVNGDLVTDLGVIVGCIALAVALGAATLRRRSA